MRKILYFLVVALLLPCSAFALRIDKGRTIINLGKDEVYKGSILVENSSSYEASVIVYLQDFKYVEPFDGQKELFPPGLSNRSISDWLKFSPQQFTLGPFAQQRFTFTIKPDVELDTTHCGVIFFETSLRSGFEKDDEMSVGVLGAMGSLIYIQPKEAVKKGKVDQIKGSNRLVRAKITNIGKAFFHASGTFFIMDSKGMAKQRGEIADVYLLPQDQASINLKITKKLSPGEYTIVATLDLEDDQLLIKEIDFKLNRSGEIAILDTRD